MHNDDNFQHACHGQPGEAFHPERDIRQGDPISPYIFYFTCEILRQVYPFYVNYEKVRCRD